MEFLALRYGDDPSMYGDDQTRALADQLRAALMLAYNQRRVG
jgi:hypothetical protein